MENNRQYELMEDAARQKLRHANPKHLAELTGLCWNGAEFEADTLGIPIRISWPECRIVPELDMWHNLTILQYLANSRGAALTGKYISMGEFYSGGLSRGASFDRENDCIIGRIGQHDLQTIRKAAAMLGGIELEEKPDLTVLFSFLPHIPMKFNLWLADEEFPASGKVLFDTSAETDLQVEAAGTAAGILLVLLERMLAAAER